MKKHHHDKPYDWNRIDHEAARWAVRQDDGLSGLEQDLFFEWLAADPCHGERYAQHMQSLRDADLLVEWRPEHSDEPNPDLLAAPSSGRRWFKWGRSGLLGLAACLAFFIFMDFDISNKGRYRIQNTHIATDSYRYERLEDGSQLDMNRGAEVKVLYTQDERRVKLLSGEVFFTVAKELERPFVVEVNGTEVRVLGTAFNIDYQADSVEVVVAEGRVEWKRTATDSSHGDEVAEPSSFSQEMVSGQKTRIFLQQSEGDELVVEAVDLREIEDLLVWRHELLDFESTPLWEAIEEFNRRNGTQLVIGDAALNEVPIAGSVRSDNIEGFVLLLEVIADIRADRDTPGQIVLRQG